MYKVRNGFCVCVNVGIDGVTVVDAGLVISDLDHLGPSDFGRQTVISDGVR